MDTMMQISEMEKKIQSLEALLSSQAVRISEMEALIKYYEEKFKVSQRQQFGAKSEKTPEELRFENIFNEAEEQAAPLLAEPTYEDVTYKRKKRLGKREEDISGLPVERIDYELPKSECICSECGELMQDIGVTIRDEIEIIPAQVIHKEHATHAYGCMNCKKNNQKAVPYEQNLSEETEINSDERDVREVCTPIIRAPSPSPLIRGSLASSSAVAHIVAQKYINGVPLYRQEKGLLYDDITLSRQTMANWIIYCAQNYLSGFYALLIFYLLKEKILHADETTFQVLHEPGREAQSKSYEWLYRTSAYCEHPIVIYDYKETRNHKHPEAFLKDFKGYLNTDGYQAYHSLSSDIIVVGCWFHARSYWENLYKTIPEDKRDGSIAERGLVYINLLFALEEEFRNLKPEARYQKRLKYSKSVSDEFFAWVGSLRALPKSLLGEAITYALNQRVYLENVYLDGRLEFSNNRAERSIKPFVQGRKQWLFANTPNGAESSSIFYSIIETARENQLHPFQYVKYLLDRLPNAKNSELEIFLPWSKSLPDECRAPEKATQSRIPLKRQSGPLYRALLRMREKFFGNAANGVSVGLELT